MPSPLPALVKHVEPDSSDAPPEPPLAVTQEAALPGTDARLTPPEADPRLSQLPAHLEPLRVLGQGGSSIVYEALHTRLKVKVAVKLLTIQGPHAEQAQKRMLREAELYALLDDPRIPRVYDVNELPDGTPYVVMEMVPGQSLEQLLAARGALPSELALAITREVLFALASVHERGVLHRDVKPANVILTLSDAGPREVRLVDFGIAKTTRGTGEEAVTLQGALVGTPHYMAPERLAGYPANASTDVYAVGIMLYEMLTGVVPFTGGSLPELMSAVMRSPPEPVDQRRGEVSPALSALVMKAMAREPEARFDAARALLSALDALSAPPAHAEAAREPSLMDWPFARRTRRRRSGKFWFVTALWSTLLVVAGFLIADRVFAPRAEPLPVPSQAVEARSAPEPAAASAGTRSAREGAIVPAHAAPLMREPRVPDGESEPPAQRSRTPRARAARQEVDTTRVAPVERVAPAEEEPSRRGELPRNPY